MADKSKIEWTDATWNPVVGCSVVSPGCTNCYAMKLAGGRMRHTPSRQGLTIDTKAGPVWNGEVRFMEEWLDQPLRWSRPRMVFVCAHGDLFHESVPDAWIDRIFAVMALCPQHTFQVLTKRSARMRAYMAEAMGRIADAVQPLRKDNRAVGPLPHLDGGERWWPLQNVWLGVSAEDQPRLNERGLDLVNTPAAVHFVSFEPLLGGIYIPPSILRAHLHGDGSRSGRIDWAIVGGESGKGARPMHPDWARDIRDQCEAAGVAFFFKQWGDWHADALLYTDTQGSNPPPDMRVGKKRAGRRLDGCEHNNLPRAAP